VWDEEDGMNLNWLSICAEGQTADCIAPIQVAYLVALVIGAVLLAIIGRRSRDFTTSVLSLMAVAIAINIAVGSVIFALRLPIYLDSIGTVLVGALAGPWAGALTGILSNLIWSILPIPGGASPTAAFFAPVPAIARKLHTLIDVGLGYVRLGQSATTLSGGEAQRVKLSLELSKRDTGRTLYILDEPTTGLHFHDIQLLLDVLHRLRDAGNTVVVIEHNLDVVKTADWIIDLGPEGGEGGGRIVAEGTPEQIAASPASHTGRYLKRSLDAGQRAATIGPEKLPRTRAA